LFDDTLTENCITRVSTLILTLYLCEVKEHTHKLPIKRIIVTHFSVLETKRLRKQKEQQRMSRDTDNIGKKKQKEDKRFPLSLDKMYMNKE
jgi:hypothetical protein